MSGLTFRIYPVDMDQLPPKVQAATIARWQPFFAALRCPARLIFCSQPFSIRPVLERLQNAGLQAGQKWQQIALDEHRDFIRRQAANLALRMVRQYLLLWPDSPASGRALAEAAQAQFGMKIEQLPALPALFQGTYEEGWDALYPRQAGRPYLAALLAADMRGEWTRHSPLLDLLRLPWPVAVAVDIKTIPPGEATYKLTLADNAIRSAARTREGQRDPRSEAAQRDIQVAMAHIGAAGAGETLHLVRAAVLVKAAGKKTLQARVARIREQCEAKMPLEVLPGRLIQTLKFFSSTPTGELGVPDTARNVLSSGAAVMAGALGYCRREQTKGVLWGIAGEGYPIWIDGFKRKKGEPAGTAPYHAVIVGETGFGKTMSVGGITLRRHALQGIQIIVLEPKGHSRRLAASLGPAAAYNPLSFDSMTINPLDIVYERLVDQNAYVTTLLQMMLNIRFNNHEIALLDAALREVYRGLEGPDISPLFTPRLENLCTRLNQVGGKELAQMIAERYVDGTPGQYFNAATSFDIPLDKAAILFNFQDISTQYRTLIYTVILSRIRRLIERHSRERNRVLFIDEFKHLSREPLLAPIIADMYKTLRTDGVGMWAAEQNIFTFTGLERDRSGHLDVASGRYMLDNTQYLVVFRQQPPAAQAIIDVYPDMEPFREHMLAAKPGEAVIRIAGEGVYHMFFKASGHELACFEGS